MHIVNLPKTGTGLNNFFATAMGVLFDVDDYTANLTAD